MRILLVALVAGCSAGNPVENCPNAPESDCCSEHGQCLDFFGIEFPYCSRPNRPDGGVCSECAEDRHCSGTDVCFVDALGFGICRDPDTCYEVGSTGCHP